MLLLFGFPCIAWNFTCSVMHIVKKVNAVFGNTYLLWCVKTDITVVTSAAETTSHGVLRRIESWKFSELGWYPSRSFPPLCEVFLGEWKRDALPDREIFHAHRTSPPSLSTHPPRPFIFDESLGLPSTASFHSRVTPSRPTSPLPSPPSDRRFPFCSSFAANDIAKKLNHFSQLRKPSCSSCALVTAKLSPWWN